MKEVTTCVNISAGHSSMEGPEHPTSCKLSSVSFRDMDTEASQSAASVFSLVSHKLRCHLLMAWHRQEFTRTQQAPWTSMSETWMAQQGRPAQG